METQYINLENKFISEFCSYEHSLKLKELGFNEPCLASYNNRQEPYFQICGQGDGGIYFNTYRRQAYYLVLAPLLRQAIKFLISKLDSTIEMTIRSNDSGHFNNHFPNSCNEFNDLNEAIEILIKNIK
jgi:hypothetical protein